MPPANWPTLILIGGFGLLSWAALAAWWRRDAVDREDRTRLIILAAAGISAYTLICAAADIAPREDRFWNVWNGARLLPAFCLRAGVGLYLDPWTAPISGNIYGPVHALAYLPATLMPTPVSAIELGLVWGLLLLVAPVAWTQWIVFKKSSAGLMAGAGVALLLQFCFLLAPLRYMAFSVNADIIALALGATACAALLKWLTSEARGALLVSVIAASAAVWAKQSAVPILIALPFYLAMFHGAPRAFRYTRALFHAVMTMSILFLLVFNAENLFFSMFWFPAQHPWAGSVFNGVAPPFAEGSFAGRFWVLGQALLQLIAYGLPPALLLLVARFRRNRADNGRSQAPDTIAARRASTLALTAAAFMTPIALMSRVKAGGDINALAHPLFYLTWAAVLRLSEGLSRALGSKNPPLGKAVNFRALHRVVIAGVAGLVAFATLGTARAWKDCPDHQNRAFRYARAHPDEAYFPWLPLAHVMAEGRLRHFAYGLFEREFTRLKVNDEQFRAGVPAHLKHVVFAPYGPRFVIHRYVPEHTKIATLDELSGWFILERAEPAPARRPPTKSKK